MGFQILPRHSRNRDRFEGRYTNYQTFDILARATLGCAGPSGGARGAVIVLDASAVMNHNRGLMRL